MKKLLIALSVVLTLALVAGIVCVLLFMEEPEENGTTMVDASSQSGPQLDVTKPIETHADRLEVLDYATQQNQDTVGWLEIPGTSINNSVVQAHDNFAYLRTNEKKEPDVYGCYFADYECSLGERAVFSPNTVIYGHSDLKDNPDGPRFSQLFRFTYPEFAAKTPVIRFSTIQDYMEWEIFAVFYTRTDFDYISAEPEGGAEALAKAAMERSIYDYGVTVGPEDHILTLSTCTVKEGAEDRSQRLVVMARMLPEEAETPVRAEITPKEN